MDDSDDVSVHDLMMGAPVVIHPEGEPMQVRIPGSPANQPDGIERLSTERATALQQAHNELEQRRASGDNLDAHDPFAAHRCADDPVVLSERARPPEELMPGETPSPVQAKLHKLSAKCADPSSKTANMEHFRNSMMLESNPNVSMDKTFYMCPTSASDTGYDGSAQVILQKTLNVMTASCADLKREEGFNEKDTTYQALDKARKDIRDVLGKVNEDPNAMASILLEKHCPMLKVSHETDDTDIGARVADEDDTLQKQHFAVDEQQVVKCGRYKWTKTDAKYRALNTEIKVKIDGTTLSFKHVDGKPKIEVGGHEVCVPARPDLFFKLVDFSQYTEQELARVRPKDYIPVKTLLTVATAAAPQSMKQDFQISSIVTEVGSKIKFDNGWHSWEHGRGWKSDDSDANVRAGVKAAATKRESKLEELARDTDCEDIFYRALQHFRLPDPCSDKRGRPDSCSPQSLMLGCNFMPDSDRGVASFLSQLMPWVNEPGFENSFEKCHDIAFKNGVQEMTAPFRFRPETPDDRITNRFDCDLPAPPSTEEERVALQEFALEPFKDVFIDHNVALREADKAACLLTGTCAVMPEANIRPQIGPYNDKVGQFAGRVGKDTTGNHIEAVLGNANVSSDWGMSMLSAVIEPDKNNPGFEGLEKHLCHWITDGSATRRDGSESLRKWTDLPKRIWGGGVPKHFPVMLKHKNKQSVLPRSNACYASAQTYYIGDDTAIWARLECSPYPRVANIEDNLYLIGEKGVPCFELDPNYVDKASNMTSEERSKHLRYWVDRAIAIRKNFKAAYPPTQKHHDAKRQLREVAVKPPKKGEPDIEMAEGMFDELCEVIGEVLIPCEPRDMDAHNEAIDLAAKRQKFQIQNPRCFHGKKAAKDACSFRVGDIATEMKAKGLPAYNYYVKNVTQLGRLTTAIQCALHIDERDKEGKVKPIIRAHGFYRDAIFGWCLKTNEESKDADAKATAPEEAAGESTSTSTAAGTGKKRKARA